MADWLTPAALRAQWASAPSNDALAQQLLDAAKEQVLEFAPVLAEGATIPVRYVLAQGMQARGIWESHRANVNPNEDVVGLEGFQVRMYSMAKPVRDLLRPPQPPIGIG